MASFSLPLIFLLKWLFHSAVLAALWAVLFHALRGRIRDSWLEVGTLLFLGRVLCPVPLFPGWRLSHLLPPLTQVGSLGQTGISTILEPFPEPILLAPSGSSSLFWWSIPAALTAAGIGGIVLFYFARIRQLKGNRTPLDNPEVREVLEMARAMTGVPMVLACFLSPIHTPILAGLFSPGIYLPSTFPLDNGKLLKAVVLHETVHFQRKDHVKTILQTILPLLFWFNPPVWLLCRFWRQSMEAGCDERVIGLMGPKYRLPYVRAMFSMALLHPAGDIPSWLMPGAGTGGIKRRLKQLLHPLPPMRRGVQLVLLVGTLSLLLAAGGAGSSQDSASQSARNLSVEGGFEILLTDLHRDSSLYSGSGSATSSAPASSLVKVLMALYALETLPRETLTTPLPWNGEPHPWEAWNRDQTLESALRYSTTWYFEAILQDHTEGLRRFFRQAGYPVPQKVNPLVGDFLWLTPVTLSQQTDFMAALCKGELPASLENQQLLQSFLFREEIQGRRFYGKTGTYQNAEGDISGWYSGFVEEEGRITLFTARHSSEGGAWIQQLIHSSWEEINQ